MAKNITAGAALVMRMKALGVDYIFANSGTDFPPVIEGLAEAAAKGMALPHAVTIPHETSAVAMGHGYYLGSGRAQAVMVHTNVGLANAALGAINTRTSNVPMLLFSGRTPTTEKGRFGSRTVPIGWGQEMFDQTALVREATKWDYELRFPEQIHDVVDRAHAIANSVPRGPVYVSLPRETLCESIEQSDERPQMQPHKTVPRGTDIEAAADLLANAKSPVIFAQRGAGSASAFAALSRLALEWAIPVCQYWAVELAIPTDHPMATDPDPEPLLGQADVILVIDSLAPWAPDSHEPNPSAQVIQIGQDPLFSQTPIRNFRSDLSLAGDVGETVQLLAEAMDRIKREDLTPALDKRRKTTNRTNAESWRTRDGLVAADGAGPNLTKRIVSARLGEIANAEDGTIFSELGAQLPFMRLKSPHSWYESPHSGGLGFAFPAALGYRLARPERLVMATMGDGSYIFANPVACHQIAEALGISILVVILNNSEWGAVRKSVTLLYPDGHAAQTNRIPLTDLSPSPDFASIARASRAWAQSVRTEAELATALGQALDHVCGNKGLALIDVHVAKDA